MFTLANDGKTIIEDGHRVQNLSRAVAALNACEGIPDESLSYMPIGRLAVEHKVAADMLDAYQEAREQDMEMDACDAVDCIGAWIDELTGVTHA